MSANDKKSIQKKRMMSYFISATNEIIDQEGLNGITARKVADRAGYNCATLYNYFHNLNHLIVFSSIRHLKEYSEDLPNYINATQDPIQSYLKIWECFCKHSFQNPEIYQLIFFGGLSHESVNESISGYYDIFPEEITEAVRDYTPMLLSNNIHERDYIALKAAVEKHLIKEEDIREINEMNVLLYRGTLANMVVNSTQPMDIHKSVEKILYYMIKTLKAFGVVLD